jgi:hypothetical protein
MQLDFYFFKLDIEITRKHHTKRSIRREVQKVAREHGKLQAIRCYRELVKPVPTLMESKVFVDSLLA